MNASQKMKTKFRSSKAWKEFCHKKYTEQKGVDPITLKKLYKGCNTHHMDLNEKHYKDLSNPNHFYTLNKNTHRWVHEIFNYYKADPAILDRLKKLLDEMVEINKLL